MDGMNLDVLFNVGNLLVMPFWLIMIVLPRWVWARRLIASPLIAVPPALIYAALVLPQISSLMVMLAGPTLASIVALLGTPLGSTVGWMHFLAFDLFVGRWAYLDAIDRGISPILMAPILFLTLMLGPIGLLLYFLIRRIKPNQAAHDV